MSPCSVFCLEGSNENERHETQDHSAGDRRNRPAQAQWFPAGDEDPVAE
nr:MAG TPA_asm: hypothetical protein [Caudoviricetes sp.]